MTIPQFDKQDFEAMIEGYQARIDRVRGIMAAMNGNGRRGRRKASAVEFPDLEARPAKKRHRISAEGRARIAEAQRRRWANKKKQDAKVARAAG